VEAGKHSLFGENWIGLLLLTGLSLHPGRRPQRAHRGGSDRGLALSGFDPVAYFTMPKPCCEVAIWK
jgi:hypothetical protein